MPTKAEQFCDELERLRAEATPGEWDALSRGNTVFCVTKTCGVGVVASSVTEGNAAHIVAMHNAQEALIRVVRTAEAIHEARQEGDSAAMYQAIDFGLPVVLDALPTEATGGDDGK